MIKRARGADLDDQGAVEDFTAFYMREYASVVGLGYVLSGSRAAAEDLAQDAFTSAFRQWHRVATLDKPEAWVRRAVANRAVSRRRRVAVAERAFGRVRGMNPETAMETATIEVWEAVRRLPRRQAQAIALRYLYDLDLRGVAEILGCSLDTVRTHLRRARTNLAGTLQP